MRVQRKTTKTMKTPNLTILEKQTLRAIVKGLYAELGFSDIDVEDISGSTKIKPSILRGVLSSLEQKDLIWFEDLEKTSDRKAGIRLIHLTGDSLCKKTPEDTYGVQYHKEYATEVGLDHIDLDADINIIETPKNKAKVDYLKLSYPQLAKLYGAGFIGKTRAALILAVATR